MTLEELYQKGTEMLRKADIENPSVDAFYLLEHAAGLNRTRYLMFKDQNVTQRNIQQYMDLIERRMTRIPYQYMIGKADFAGLVFEVNPSVLIPRLDTEVLFEQTLRKLGPQAYVLDLCTGSGALGISLKRYRPDIHMVLSDISGDALEVAARNVVHNHMQTAEVQERDAASGDTAAETRDGAPAPGDLECGYDLRYNIRIIQSDLFDGMNPSDMPVGTDGRESVGRFDVIVSNPPYVSESEYKDLMPEVRDYEPKLALTAGPDGLDLYRRIACDAPRFLKPGGVLLLEIGSTQARDVSELLEQNGFHDINVVKDLAELDRVVIARI